MKSKKLKNITNLKKDLYIALHFIKLVNSISKKYIPIVFISAFFKAAAPFINIIMPKFIIDELMNDQRANMFILYVGIIIIGNALFSIINRLFNSIVSVENMSLINGLEKHLGKHIMNMDFENLENPDILDQKEKALFTVTNQGAIYKMLDCIINLFQIIITLVGLIAIIATLNILIIGIIILVVILNSLLYKKSQSTEFEFNQSIITLNRKYNYFYNLTYDFSMAKDVRLYNMAPYILSKFDDFTTKSSKAFNNFFVVLGKYQGLSNINIQIQMVLVYAYMAVKVLFNQITVGDYTLFIGAANNFSTNITNFLKEFITFRQMCKYLDLYLQFESIKPIYKLGNKKICNTKKIEIEFKNVYFKYPSSDDYTLKNVSIKINNGEKLAVVGQNGAGKTTFIKLLCRLYHPQKGQILINGTNINQYSQEEYIKLLSVVFQDFKLFAFTIKENIVLNSNNINNEKIILALKKSGLYNKIKELDKGLDTSLYKNFDKDGVELSGGQNQKLAIARAIYKNSPIVILDEPTAALDPYAEYDIYSRFNELIQNKTAIYISHRLSSCCFCDKIAVFNKGELIEYGSHEELKGYGGKYSEMWNAQAQYYVS